VGVLFEICPVKDSLVAQVQPALLFGEMPKVVSASAPLAHETHQFDSLALCGALETRIFRFRPHRS
jgi:hypothetical protein